MKKRKFSLTDKMFPFPAVVTAVPVYLLFLDDEGFRFVRPLILTGLILLAWGFIGPKLEPPLVGDPKLRRPQDGPMRQDDYMYLRGSGFNTFDLWGWTERFYRDAAFLGRQLALALLGLAAVTGVLAWFSPFVILRRANIVIALCALGLLALGIAALGRKLRRRKESNDRAAYPTPQVNMTYDHDAAADARERALHQRLARLDEWLAAGMIDKEEFDTLRKKYLGK